jgi:putative hemolysin
MHVLPSSRVLRFESTVRLLEVGEVSPGEITQGKYVVRLARTQEEVDAALRLRFKVFNLERSEGLATSFSTGRDEDGFDSTSDHLILIERSRRQVVGTYRLRNYENAKTPEGFHSSTEFDLSSLPIDVPKNAIEVSRACIAKSHRNTSTLRLLWKGLASYSMRQQKHYLFGCVSLSGLDPVEGGQLFELLSEGGHLHAHLRVQAQMGFKCLWYKTLVSNRGTGPLRNPIQPYLQLGAKVCGPPAMNRQFRTIDFFTILDLKEVEPRVSSLLFRGIEGTHEIARSA